MASLHWVPVDDAVAFAIATVEHRNEDNGTVRLKRVDPPPGVDPMVTLPSAEADKLLPVSGDPSVAVDDLVRLADVNHPALLHNLRLRYEDDDIFTAIGPILITTNPYKPLASCEAEYMSSMTQVGNKEELPPHIFRIAHSAYSVMMQTRSAQSVLISGESGAGKTETTKLCMGCLAEISGSSGQATEAALESGVLLESFGNAKTVHNNNSSRFGKWCAMHFDESGRISACQVLSYLLEKSRVVGPGDGERNYHIFYQMLAGVAEPEERASLHLLGEPAEYLYLQGPTTVDGVDDKDDWAKTGASLGSLGFSDEQRGSIHRLCAAVLQLGNVAFTPGASEGEMLSIVDTAPLDAAASLLEVEPTALKTSVLSRKVASGRGSSYTVPLAEQQCLDTRDALAKALYKALFDWVVSRLNAFMSTAAGAAIDEEAELFVGLLDVFGFENFEFNSFEQLCINFTNEKLQQHFIMALVKLQQQDYEREGLRKTDIAFPDNSEQLTLLDAKMGVMGLLDEECALPKGSEGSYVEKMHKLFGPSPHYEKPMRGSFKLKRRSVLPSATPTAVQGRDVIALQFTIAHYAGKVTYTAEGWLEKNRGFLQPELAFLMSTSRSPLLKALFPPDRHDDKKSSTILSTFRASLRALSTTLLQTNARYIRCIKPNAEKRPGFFDGHFIARQLRYTGVSAVVEIQRSGYPISLPKADFVKRYRSCVFSEPALVDPALPIDTLCTNVLDTLQQLLGLGGSWLGELSVQLGKTKIFLREEIVREIEKAREAIWEEAASAAQRVGRGRITRKATGLLRAHAKAAARVRRAMDDKQVSAAAAAVGALQKEWDDAAIPAMAAPTLAAAKRELAELRAQVTQLEGALAQEVRALAELEAALGDGEFVGIKVALQKAAEASPLRLSAELGGATARAEAALAAEEQRIRAAEDKRLADELQQKQAEVERQAKERQRLAEDEAAAFAAARAAEVARLVVEVRNDPSAEGMGLGLELNAMNTVTSMMAGGLAARDRTLRVGDVITHVDGVALDGRKALSAMDERATSYQLTVLRSGGGGDGADDDEPPIIDDGGGLRATPSHRGVGHLEELGVPPVDMEGWLTKVKTSDGRQARLPERRWCVLQGTTLSWYKDAQMEHEANSQTLANAECVLPNKASMTKAMKDFASVQKFPFLLTWPNKQNAYDFVFAASSSANRAEWVTALKAAIERAKADAPSAGWLYKEGGRKTGFSLSGWKRRWFVLAQGSKQLKYYDAPTASTPKGVVSLTNADVFVPKQVRGIKSDYKINLCIASEGIEKGVPTTVCTLLAATTVEERDGWVKSLSAAIAHKPPAANHSGVTRDAGLGGADPHAASLQSGASNNLHQMMRLTQDELLTLRIKQLKDVLNYMGIDAAELSGMEKKDLVALIERKRASSRG